MAALIFKISFLIFYLFFQTKNSFLPFQVNESAVLSSVNTRVGGCTWKRKSQTCIMFLVIFLLSFLVEEFQMYTLFWLLYAFKYFLISICNCLKHSIFLKILSVICGRADLSSLLQYLTIAGYSALAFFFFFNIWMKLFSLLFNLQLLWVSVTHRRED